MVYNTMTIHFVSLIFIIRKITVCFIIHIAYLTSKKAKDMFLFIDARSTFYLLLYGVGQERNLAAVSSRTTFCN